MRCKKHAADLSSRIGVCASCLRDRLFAIMEKQSQPLPLSFPPYIHQRSLYTTPQLAPPVDEVNHRKSHGARFSTLFSGLFRSKSEKLDLNSGLNHGVSGQPSSPSPFRFSNMIPGRRRKKIRSFSVDETSIRARRDPDRGMSPARCSGEEDDDEHCRGGSSGYSSQGWRQTPRRTPVAARRSGAGQNRNISGLAFCLSPLVRASPNWQWNQKGVTPEPGESRAPAKAHLSAAASFCKNRSRKLADFGRYNSRH